jgi:hypothetical protein
LTPERFRPSGTGPWGKAYHGISVLVLCVVDPDPRGAIGDSAEGACGMFG